MSMPMSVKRVMLICQRCITVQQKCHDHLGVGATVLVEHLSCKLQNLAEDWSTGSTGCYDSASLARLQSTLKYDFQAVANGNCDLCLNLPIADDFRKLLISETLRADAQSLGKLMADHTQVRPTKAVLKCVCYSSVQWPWRMMLVTP